jgi:predicted transcriptional regulator
MSRPKPTKDDLKDREKLAIAVKKFAKENLFTEVKLADVMGVSRRTIQMIKAAKVSPNQETMKKWRRIIEQYKEAAEVTRLVQEADFSFDKPKKKRKVA